MSTVLVTGGTGVLGRHVVAQLAAAGDSVRVLSRRDEPVSRCPTTAPSWPPSR